jgi:hypothetical protein
MALISLMVSHSQTCSVTVFVFGSVGASSVGLVSPSSLISASSSLGASSVTTGFSSSSSAGTVLRISFERKSLIGY